MFPEQRLCSLSRASMFEAMSAFPERRVSWVAWQAAVGLCFIGSQEAGCPASCSRGRRARIR